MSDAMLTTIVAKLLKIEEGMSELRDGQTQLRVDVMARFDRLQTRLDQLDELQTMGFGSVDTTNDNMRVLTDQMAILRRLYQRLAVRVDQLEHPQ